MIDINIGGIIDGVGRIADDLFTSDEERLKLALDDKRIDAGLIQGQLDINKAEAAHKSVFVAGWRPCIGWVGAAAMAYQFLLYPLMIWLWTFAQAKTWIPSQLAPPPILDTQALWVVITGMLGVAGMRSYDKKQSTQTDKIK